MTCSQWFSVFVLLGSLTLSVPAFADIPPDDACSASAVGEECLDAIRGTGTTFANGLSLSLGLVLRALGLPL